MKQRLWAAAILTPLCLIPGSLLVRRWLLPKKAHRPTHAAVAAPGPAAPAHADRNAERIDYTRDIKPILSGACYSCHGPDEATRQAGLRLDRRADAVRSAVVPGDAGHSLLVAKVSSADEQERMPPPEAKKHPLTAGQVALLRRWIDEGARFEDHWSFVPPSRPAPPATANAAWVRNPIDAFVAAGQEAHGLGHAPEADRATLLRRLSFDVTGLPPTPEEVAAFVGDPAPDAYEKQVDRLLASPHYGERMTTFWLDLVRYADTDGYSVDADRKVWMYRDYVIDAFNRDERFDRFTTRQLAGDLLQDAGRDDLVASGYNRLLMTSQEGCAEPEERRVKYAADRVRNVSSVWLGLTMGCAECHDHKFDPLSQKDFYRLAAFFADVQEAAVGPQTLTPFPDPRKPRLDALDAEIARAREAWEARAAADDDKGIPEPIAGFLRTPRDKRTSDKTAAIEQFFLERVKAADDLKDLRGTVAERARLKRECLETLVTTSGPPRVVRVLRRGDWQDATGEVVAPALPLILRPPTSQPAAAGAGQGGAETRLDLARWIVSPQNPLTGRVLANRLWKIAFGKGLVTSLDDFGAQGVPPTHPELLDWLAVQLIDSGWDVKALLRLMFRSSAYRQSSDAPADVQERDPANLWLARQNRFRLDAEFIRDNALAVAGLLAPEVGGPSVKPCQPDGYWADRFTEKIYETDAGPAAHRRGLYTFWCRNYLHPELGLFDAPTRTACTGERMRSATPLQALALLNDPASVEAARGFAARLIREAPPEGRFVRAYRLALARDPTPEEEAALGRLYAREAERCHGDAGVAAAQAGAGQPCDDGAAELAAWTAVCRVILNLRETVTRY